MLDVYWHGASLSDAESLARRLVQAFYRGPFERLSLAQRVRKEFRIDLVSDELRKQRLHELLMARYPGRWASFLQVLDRYVREEIEPLSKGRCLIVDEFPHEAEVRARKRGQSLHLAHRFEFQIDGVEVVHGYSDELDPSLLESRTKGQGNFGPEDQLMCALLDGGAVPADSSGFGVGV